VKLESFAPYVTDFTHRITFLCKHSHVQTRIITTEVWTEVTAVKNYDFPDFGCELRVLGDFRGPSNKPRHASTVHTIAHFLNWLQLLQLLQRRHNSRIHRWNIHNKEWGNALLTEVNSSVKLYDLHKSLSFVKRRNELLVKLLEKNRGCSWNNGPISVLSSRTKRTVLLSSACIFGLRNCSTGFDNWHLHNLLN
jgi:hypothetical protein